MGSPAVSSLLQHLEKYQQSNDNAGSGIQADQAAQQGKQPTDQRQLSQQANYHTADDVNDNVNQRYLSLDAKTKSLVNAILAEYVSLTATEVPVE